MRASNGLDSLTIKPTWRCNAKCPYCTERQDYYRQSLQKREVTFEQWEQVIDDAVHLGASALNISGGEPTLYPRLTGLVAHAVSAGIPCHLKTNAYLLDEQLANEMALYGLHSCTISLYSHQQSEHDSKKYLRGSHTAAVNAIRLLTKRGVSTYAQAILSSVFLDECQDYLRWCASLGVSGLFLSYVEGAAGYCRPTEADIQRFTDSTLPQIMPLLRDLVVDEELRVHNQHALQTLFSFADIPHHLIATGVYNGDIAGCGRHRTMAMVLANGDIHPCNAVEYFHEPIVGNVLESPLRSLWDGERWKNVRASGLTYCRKCPMTRHLCIRFHHEPPPPFYSVSYNHGDPRQTA